MDTLDTLSDTPVINVRRSTLNGREYLVGDVTFLREGVLSGSKGHLYYPYEEIEKRPGVWNGVVLTANHPMNGDRPESARTPAMMAKYNIGFVFNDTLDRNTKSRKGEVWVDVELANKVDKRIIPAIINGTKINVSTGLFTVDEKVNNEATYNGKSYTHVARNYQPDHLAVLLDHKGACSVTDGCGINLNSKTPDAKELANVSKWLDKNGAMPGYGQVFVKGNDVWYVGGDGDDWSEKNLPIKKFKEVEGVANVTYEAEGFPPKDEGWIKVNTSGENHMRKELVSWLTTNCDCYKNKEAVLNDDKSFTEEELKKLKTNAEQATLAINSLKEVSTTLGFDDWRKVTLNELVEKCKTVKTEADKKKEEPTTMNAEQVTQVVHNYLKNLDEKQRIELIASPTLNNLIKTGEEMINEKRKEIMTQLVANSSSPEDKKAKLLKLKDKTLPQLKELLEFANVTANADTKTEEERFLAQFFNTGVNNSGATPPKQRHRSKPEDALVPTMSVNIHSDDEYEVVD